MSMRPPPHSVDWDVLNDDVPIGSLWAAVAEVVRLIFTGKNQPDRKHLVGRRVFVSWNYRIVGEKSVYSDAIEYRIAEVYYDGFSPSGGLSTDVPIKGWSRRGYGTVDGWENPAELKATLKKMLEATTKPVLRVVHNQLVEESSL